MTAICAPFMDYQPTIYQHSPKRKRAPELAEPRLITLGIRRASDAADSTDGLSPSTRVTGKFQRLQLQHQQHKHQHKHGKGTILHMSAVRRPSIHETLRTPSDHRPAAKDESHNSSVPDSISASTPTPLTSSSSTNPADPPPLAPAEAPELIFTFTSDLPLPPLRSTSPLSTTTNTPSSLFWQSTEITGWSPGDPDEDNYGVNGIGYRKTPALARLLSQRRKQQIAEWRSRECAEARRRRGARRGDVDADQGGGAGEYARDGDGERPRKKVRRVVRFADHL